MPTKTAKKNARKAKRQGKRPSTQAGSFVKEEMHQLHKGRSGIKSRKQAIAIGLSEARRSGVKLSPPKKGKSSASVRKKAKKDYDKGQGRSKTSPTRSRGAKKAAATRKRNARSGR
jgi:hypothetical protein